jgi:hypothetical protein
VYIAQPQVLDAPAAPTSGHARRRIRDRDSIDLHRLVEDTLARLDAPALRLGMPLDRLAAVAASLGEALDCTTWTISHAPREGRTLQTVRVVEGRGQPGLHFDAEGHSYEVDSFPETRRILAAGGSFVVAAEDEEADAAERRLLEQWSLTAVLAAAAPSPAGSWLVELYADEHTRDLHTTAAHARLLVAEAIRGAAWDPPASARVLRLA